MHDLVLYRKTLVVVIAVGEHDNVQLKLSVQLFVNWLVNHAWGKVGQNQANSQQTVRNCGVSVLKASRTNIRDIELGKFERFSILEEGIEHKRIHVLVSANKRNCTLALCGNAGNGWKLNSYVDAWRLDNLEIEALIFCNNAKLNQRFVRFQSVDSGEKLNCVVRDFVVDEESKSILIESQVRHRRGVGEVRDYELRDGGCEVEGDVV